MTINRSNHITFRENKAWWKLIFPFICFCIALGILYDCHETILSLKPEESVIGVFLGWTFASMLFVILGIVFAMERDQHFDLIRKRFKVLKRVGIISIGNWQTYKTLDYVSAYRNSDGEVEINLWYNSNSYFTISTHFSEEIALERAIRLSQKLNISFHNGLDDQQINYEDDSAKPISKDQRKIDAYLSQGNRPLWQTIISAVIFTAAFAIIYYFFLGVDIEEKRIGVHPYVLKIPILLIAIGIGISIVNDYVFDIENKQYKVVHNIGPIRWGRWRTLRTIDYVSVFKKSKNKYLVNIWYNTNRHMTVTLSPVYEDAIFMGKSIAKKLRVELLDASNPHDKKWIEVD